MAPITADGTLPDLRGLKAILFRNAGTATVNFNSGAYTLDSKETVSFNVTEDDRFTEMWFEGLQITFDTSTGSVKKLQIIVIKAEVRTNC